MTSAELDALVETLRASTPLRRILPVAARMVFLQMLAVGYDLVKVAQPGRTYPESDLERHELLTWLRDVSPLGSLSYPESKQVFDSLGYRIQEPLTHPSGLKTTAKPYVKVTRLGAGTSYKVVDRQGLPDGPVATFNGGISE
jgi:hypothetical protein